MKRKRKTTMVTKTVTHTPQACTHVLTISCGPTPSTWSPPSELLQAVTQTTATTVEQHQPSYHCALPIAVPLGVAGALLAITLLVIVIGWTLQRKWYVIHHDYYNI